MAQVNDASATDDVTEQVADKVHDAALAVQEKASELREGGSARLREQFEQRSSQAGVQVRLVAEALRRGGSELESQGNGAAAQVTSQAAERIEHLGSYLEQRSGEQVLADVESFARRRPWLVAGVGALAGLAAARFMKASSTDRFSEVRWPPIQPRTPVAARTPSSDRSAISSDRPQGAVPSGRQA